jgi:hypothetical protein
MRPPRWIVPALVVLFAMGGIQGARLLSAPSVVREYGQASAAGRLLTVAFVVQGIRCVDTAEGAAGQLEGVPGVVRFTAYASGSRAVVTYDPQRTDEAMLKEAIEGPVFNPAEGEYRFGVYKVIEVNGDRVE